MPMDDNAAQAASFLGQDQNFWITVAVASGIKWLMSKRGQSLREIVASTLSGAAAAYYGHDWVIRSFDTITDDDKALVIIGLVFIGEHLVRLLINLRPSRKLGEKFGLEFAEEEKVDAAPEKPV